VKTATRTTLDKCWFLGLVFGFYTFLLSAGWLVLVWNGGWVCGWYGVMHWLVILDITTASTPLLTDAVVPVP
jgi:hypothetical protein